MFDPLREGEPALAESLPEGRPLDYKRNSISFHNRGPRRRDLRLPVTKLMGPESTERFRADVRAVVDRTFPLDEASAAMRYYEDGSFVGKIVLEM